MIDDLHPYPEYKQLSTAWLGRSPAHWQLRRLKYILRERDTRSSTGKEQLLRVSQYTGVTERTRSGGLEEPDTRADSLVGYKQVEQDDLVVNIMLAWNGSMGVSRFHGIASPAYCVYRFGPIAHPWYFHYLLRSPIYKARIRAVSTGVVESRLRLYSDDLYRLESFLPPANEQAAIVRFLDHANGKIERAIRAKRKLIALLTEQKQAIIHRAVTRGLEPSVKLKPSGIPWLIETPSHWIWTPIKRLLSRMDYGTSEATKADGRIRVLTMGNIQRGEVTVPKSGGLDEVPRDMLLEQHDLLFTRTNGNPDLVGKVGIFRGTASDQVSFASYLVRLRVTSPHDAQWLHLVLNSASFWPFARSHALVNLQTNLNSTRYGQFQIPVPPPSEQVRIVNQISLESKALNAAIARTETEIALLREYRTTLTADVVTGKLDVREAVKHLPAEAEDPLSAADLPAGDLEDETPEEPDP
jgi:type I restriction enzyme S subunit